MEQIKANHDSLILEMKNYIKTLDSLDKLLDKINHP